MKSLGRDMQTITDAISKEDWATVAETAPKIAHHSEPSPSETKLISEWLGSNSELFEALDEHTHEAARGVRKAAESGMVKKLSRRSPSCRIAAWLVINAFEKHS
jgi:hypothetical protein